MPTLIAEAEVSARINNSVSLPVGDLIKNHPS